jgi:hypothetical protein
MGTGRELFRNEYVVVTLEQNGMLLRMIRTAVPYPNTQSLEDTFDQIFEASFPYRQRGWTLLSDQRLAPGRNDPAFEQAMARIRLQLYPLFRKRAIWVQSKVGVLHISRLAKEDGVSRLVSTDEAEILAYLAQE